MLTHVNDIFPHLRVDTLADIKPKTTGKCRARESQRRLQTWEETCEALPWASWSAGTGWYSDLPRLIKHGRGDLDTSSQTSSATDLSWRSPGLKNHVSRKAHFLSRRSLSQFQFSFQEWKLKWLHFLTKWGSWCLYLCLSVFCFECLFPNILWAHWPILI